MHEKVLVAYASYKGSTIDVAEFIGRTISDSGAVVDVLPAYEVSDLSIYRAVIVGSAIYDGAWMPDALEFVTLHRRALHRMPVALFTVCLTMRDDCQKSRMMVLGFMDPVLKMLPEVKPEDVGLFAGRFDPHQWPFWLRPLLMLKLRAEGDFRNWETVRSWAVYTRQRLISEASHA